MATIKFNFEEDKPSIIIKDVEEGLSILDIAEDNDIPLNHNCGAVCACSTCHVYIDKGEELFEEITDKEEDFIDRAINPRLESRLGCQAVLLTSEGDIEVTIPDQSGIIGHH